MTEPPRAVVSWSSGKDCAWALHLARQDYRIEGLLCTLNERFDRVAMHGTRAEILRAQAAALGLALIEVPLPWPCSNADYEARMAGVCEDLKARDITHVIFGDLFLEDVRAYREAQLDGTGLTPVFPLFGRRDTDVLAREMMAGGICARLVTCDPKVLGAGFAGRVWDEALLNDLPPGVDPCGENGEFHTMVTNSPDFTAPLAHRPGETVLRDGFAYADMCLA